MNILVTGGAGYIGSVLTTSLVNDNHYVTCLDNLLFNENFISNLSSFKNFKFVKQDINNLIINILNSFNLIYENYTYR